MRQNALIVYSRGRQLRAEADFAFDRAGDRIFSRIGASDDLAGGRSTFMSRDDRGCEHLNNATAQSLC